MKAEPVLKLLIDGGQGGEYSVDTVAALPHERTVWRLTKVGASRGYLVLERRDGIQRCECPGFTYRQRCKHLEALRRLALISPAEEQECATNDPRPGQRMAEPECHGAMARNIPPHPEAVG